MLFYRAVLGDYYLMLSCLVYLVRLWSENIVYFNGKIAHSFPVRSSIDVLMSIK